jgi:hypothetical protein
MLPDIDSYDGNVGQKRILVRSGENLQAFGSGVQTLSIDKINQTMPMMVDIYGTYKPSPPRTLNTKSGSVELLLQVFKTAECLFDSGLQGTIMQIASMTLLLRRSWGKILPEQRVIDMS